MENRLLSTPSQELLNEITNEETLRPNIPVSSFLQEAEFLYKWCQTDKKLLTAAGLDWQLVEDLPTRLDILRSAETQWSIERKMKKDAIKEWQEKSPVYYDFRRSLLHQMGYAFRKQNTLLKKLKYIRNHIAQAHLPQDFSNLAQLGDGYPELLSAINFNMQQLDKARDYSSESARLLARVNREVNELNQIKHLRDKAFTYLKQAVDEIRHCGQFVFWKDKERATGYLSAYYRRGRRRRKNAAAELQEQ